MKIKKGMENGVSFFVVVVVGAMLTLEASRHILTGGKDIVATSEHAGREMFHNGLGLQMQVA